MRQTSVILAFFLLPLTAGLADVVAHWRVDTADAVVLGSVVEPKDALSAPLPQGTIVVENVPPALIGTHLLSLSFTEENPGATLSKEGSELLSKTLAGGSFTIEAQILLNYPVNYGSILTAKGPRWFNFGTAGEQTFAFNASSLGAGERQTSGLLLESGKWLHVAAVARKDGDDAIVQLFINGIPVGDETIYVGGIEVDPDSIFSIGGPAGFPGQIHQVRVSDESLEPTQFLNEGQTNTH